MYKGSTVHKIILVILLAVMSCSVMVEWVEVGSNEYELGDEYVVHAAYADPDTIRKTGNTVKMWSLLDYKMAEEELGTISVRQKEEYDCKEKQLRTLFESFHTGHMADGETVFIHNVRGDWEPALPDSVAEAVLEFACRFRPKLPQTFPSETFS